MFLFLLTVSFIAIVIHSLLMKERTAKKVVEVALLYLLVINFGLGSLISGFAHIFMGPQTAAMIGWPAGSPFQYEVGVADMAFGFICFLCLFFRGSFWLAAILAESFFLLGCMIGHLRSLVESGNLAAYNIGPNIIISDLIMPFVLIGLYIMYRKMKD
ncbi:MAG: DUF6790 family protein [Candidatus Margulisiibacteriota bacterium]